MFVSAVVVANRHVAAGLHVKVVSVRRTEEFARWLRGLRELRAEAFI